MAEEFNKEDHTSNTLFQDAVNSLRRGDKPRAKELLTQLLKTDQNNPTYWVWLSASVDAQKERIYCLQTALKLDPENGTAKRGLILLGALPPDDTIQPFPMNRPRAWEEKLLLATEKPKEKGLKAFTKSPVARLMGVVVIAAALCSVVVFGFVLPRQTNVVPTQTNTPGASPTFTTTPTLFGATAIPTRVFSGPTPLWAYLPETYTPTPQYVNTPRSAVSSDYYRLAQDALKKGDLDAYITNMRLIIPIEPTSADIPFLIGEAYRLKGETANAQKAYEDAIDTDPNFGPAYVGLARMRLIANQNFNAEPLLQDAIEKDPNYGEAYLELARFYAAREDFEDAFDALELADQLMPGSPEVNLVYASVYLASEDEEKALEYAELAYSQDITNLSTYKLLGDLYIAREDYARAAESLRVYTTFETEDALSFARLSQAYYELGEYKLAVDAMNKATTLNRTGLRRFYVYRGLSHLELGDVDEAVNDLETAVQDDDKLFIARVGLARGYYLQEKFGSAFLQVEAMKSIAETDEEEALALYWRALVQENRNEIRDAIKSWNDLLAMDEDVMTPEMRQDALDHLKELGFSTPTPKVPTATLTPRTTATATRTPTSAVSPTATRTPTPTRTP